VVERTTYNNGFTHKTSESVKTENAGTFKITLSTEAATSIAGNFFMHILEVSFNFHDV
jgi:hypothetical protein